MWPDRNGEGNESLACLQTVMIESGVWFVCIPILVTTFPEWLSGT